MSGQLDQPPKNDDKNPRRGRLLKWVAGIAAAIVSGVAVWWLTHQGPFVQKQFQVSVTRADYSKLFTPGHQHEINAFIKNTGTAPLTGFSLQIRVWAAGRKILDHKTNMYGDPDVCQMVNLLDENLYYEFHYECSVVNPGENLIFSVTYAIDRRGVYSPAMLQVFLKSKGFTYNEAIETDERYPLGWRDNL